MEQSEIQRGIRLRPTLERVVDVAPEQLLERIRQGLASATCKCEGTVVDRHIELLIKGDHRHFWSPWLSAEVYDHQDGQARIFGRFGPRPAIWTGLAFSYACIAFATISAAIFAMSQATLGRSPTALWVLPVCLVFAGALYLAGLTGRKVAAEQIGWIRRMLDCSLEGEQGCAGDRCFACPQWSDAPCSHGRGSQLDATVR
ncbi:MAG: hypothetical protein H6707_04565 [Deltaproteobacteria bacterium]|nr:hypothetical protein [Deltaproteobacteria bacterium]